MLSEGTFPKTDNEVMATESAKDMLDLLGQSTSSFMIQVYAAAAVLFVLVLFAGIMMIASSLNSNVAQRTEFFGLMRCVGATPKQIMRLVRKEALTWCDASFQYKFSKYDCRCGSWAVDGTYGRSYPRKESCKGFSIVCGFRQRK